MDGKRSIRYIIKTIHQAKRIIIIVIGFTVLMIGIIMTVLPGPSILVIPFGLLILASEFVWAKVLLRQVRERLSNINISTGLSGKKKK